MKAQRCWSESRKSRIVHETLLLPSTRNSLASEGDMSGAWCPIGAAGRFINESIVSDNRAVGNVIKGENTGISPASLAVTRVG